MKGCLLIILVALGALGISFFALTRLALSPPDKKMSPVLFSTASVKPNPSIEPTIMLSNPPPTYNYSGEPVEKVSPTVTLPGTRTPSIFKKIYTEPEINAIIQSEVAERLQPEFRNAVKSVSVQLLEKGILIYTNIDTDYLPKEIHDKIPFLSYAKSIYVSSEVGISVQNNKPVISVNNFQIGKLRLPVGILESTINRELIEEIVFNYLVQNNIKLEKIFITNKQIVIEASY